MGIVNPGYSFGVNETVTANKLQTFIENATINDINWSEVDSSLPRFATTGDTAFSLGPEGTVWWDTVRRSLMVQSRHGPLALFRGKGGLESRRFACTIGEINPYVCVGIDVNGDPADSTEPGLERRDGTTTSNLGDRVLGINQEESGTTGAHIRFVIGPGVTKARFDNANDLDAESVGNVVGVATVQGLLAEPTSIPATDKVCAAVLGRAADDAGGGVSLTGYVFLFPPVWRGT